MKATMWLWLPFPLSVEVNGKILDVPKMWQNERLQQKK
jgi:hypothetical protein